MFPVRQTGVYIEKIKFNESNYSMCQLAVDALGGETCVTPIYELFCC